MASVSDLSRSGTWLAGNVGGAWLINDRLHRQTGPWTPAVHALLEHLAARGLPHIPRVIGFDTQAREVLTYLPGRVVDIDAAVLSPAQLHELMTWTRGFHDAAAGFEHPGPWRFPTAPGATLIGHNDIAPYNACFDGDRLVGVFDWDMASPTTPVMELAFIAWNCVPLWRDIGDAASLARLQLICTAYGQLSPAEVIAAVPDRIQLMLDWIPRGAAGGDEGLRRLLSLGEPGRSQAALDNLIPRLSRMQAALDGSS